MFTKKEKIEMTEAEKEQKELEKQAKKLRRKEGAIKFLAFKWNFGPLLIILLSSIPKRARLSFCH